MGRRPVSVPLSPHPCLATLWVVPAARAACGWGSSPARLTRLPLCSLLLFVDEADAFLRKRATVSVWRPPGLLVVAGAAPGLRLAAPASRGAFLVRLVWKGGPWPSQRASRGALCSALGERPGPPCWRGPRGPDARAFAPQEKISEDLRAALNAFLHRTGQHSSK